SMSMLPESAYNALGLPSDTVKILMNPKPPDTPVAIAAPNLLQNDTQSAGPVALNESSIALYAELLLHIRTVTLFASLRTHHTHETKAQLSADGASITISHESESATIRLPIKVQDGGGGDAALHLPAQPPSKELTLRLQLEEREGSDLLGTLQSEERKANIVPWDGASLSQMQGVEIMCKSCGEVVVPRGKVGSWRDLPNENWAEMMDFWHCHKPDEGHLHDHENDEVVGKKGYAAGNRLKAKEGMGFVDLTSLLLEEGDCEGVEIASKQQEDSIVCKHCKHTLGARDESSSGHRIWKWSISLSPSPSAPPTTYTTQKWISARLLFLIENSGVRKFHIHPPPNKLSSSPSAKPDPSTPSLLLWVFTPDLLFSSSVASPHRSDPTRAMKVFYKRQTWRPIRPGEVESASVEDVEFPGSLFGEVERVLGESRDVLPVGAREFQGWDVGLLERF
ncbi:hypothetical protein P153DRAFT_283337, partial [Dothidotthia symphoricarpi CBS 119687]